MRAPASCYGAYGTGAVPLAPDERDWQMERLPGVAEQLANGGPPARHDWLLGFIDGCYNQGGTPSCVLASEAGMKSIQENIEHDRWLEFDFDEAYRALGGDGRQGVPTRESMKWLRDTGMLQLGTTRRYRIGSYAFAPQTAERWKQTVQAAIAANQPCVVACLLPSVFGWDSNTHRTEAYHQMCAVAYDEEFLVLLNSWGKGWGKDGLCRLRWDYLTAGSLQDRLCYAYTTIDAVDEGLAPVPVPAPAPAPLPEVPLAVTGYLGQMPVTSGQRLQVVGEGFGVGVLQAVFTDQPCEILERQERLLTVRLPEVALPTHARLVVQREALRAEGPPLWVNPAPAVDAPPVKITVTLEDGRSGFVTIR